MQNNLISWCQPSKIGAALSGDYSGETKERKTSHSEAANASLFTSKGNDTAGGHGFNYPENHTALPALKLMPCDNDARAPNLGAKANGGEKKHIHLFAGLKEETLLQISSPHRDSIPEQSHSKVISGWIGHWVSLDCSLLIQSLAHGCHSIISKAEMRNWRARGIILQLCFLTSLLPVNVATQMMRVTSKPFLRSDSKCIWVQKPW